MNNILIGSTDTTPPNTPFWIKVHDKIIYDSESWSTSGTLVWNAVSQQFEVLPNQLLHDQHIQDASGVKKVPSIFKKK
jgi:hypothetical protein